MKTKTKTTSRKPTPYYAVMAETSRGNYDVLQATYAPNANQARKVFKGQISYLKKPKRYGEVIIVKMPRRVEKWWK